MKPLVTWTVEKQAYERCALSGPVETVKQAKQYMADEGFEFLYCGPYTNDEMAKNKIGATKDAKRFLIIGQRNIPVPAEPAPRPIDWDSELTPA